MATAGGPRVRFAEEDCILSASAESRALLCKVCRSINLQKYRYQEMSGYIALGKWSDILQKTQCPFCCLVVEAFEQQLDRIPFYHEDQILLTNYPSWELGVEMSPYDKLRSAACSNKFDLRSMAKKFNYTTYRLLVYVKEYNERFGLIQYLTDREDIAQDRGQFHGRQIDASKVDLNLLRSWLDRCGRFHGAACEQEGSKRKRLPVRLRLIDTASRSLVLASTTTNMSYLTLSYVWGSQAMMHDTGLTPVTTRQADLGSTKSGKKSTHLPERLPQTIEDAIFVTRHLGFRYLWIDALCLAQDDNDDKTTHLQNMDAIYSCSVLTIVAGSGAHADTGLPGLSSSRAKAPPTRTIGSSQLAAMSPSFTDLENSRSLVWNTKGWTFQEKVFARRLLLFTDYQVYFRCFESIWTEEIVMETEQPSQSSEARPGRYRWVSNKNFQLPKEKLDFVKSILPEFDVSDEKGYSGRFPDYAAAIQEYSQRQVSDQDDKLIAIHGILRSLQPDAGRFIYGLPESHLLQSLLWRPERGSTCVCQNNALPSWTWAGWSFGKGVVYDVLDIKVVRTVLSLVRSTLCDSRNGLKGTRPPPESVVPGISCAVTSCGVTSSHASGPCSVSLRSTSSQQRTTSNTMSRVTLDIGNCFGWTLPTRRHTMKQVFLYANGQSQELLCERPLAMTNRTKTEHTGHRRTRKVPSKSKNSDTGLVEFHEQMAARYRRPVLALLTAVVHFFVGASLEYPCPIEDDEVGCYELLDGADRCVGEVWTTRKQAIRGRDHALTFVTVSWGMSLTRAEVAPKYVPCWDFDAALFPKAKASVLIKACEAVEDVINETSAKHLSATYGLCKGRPAGQQPPLATFFDALLEAEKGKPRPKFLWSTVNVLQVQHVGDDKYNERDRIPVFKRTGVGRVMSDAWLDSSPSSFRRIILA